MRQLKLKLKYTERLFIRIYTYVWASNSNNIIAIFVAIIIIIIIFIIYYYPKVVMKEAFKYLAGIAGPSGYGSGTTAEEILPFHHSSPQLTAIVTGGTSGIGEETARVLARRGVRVVIPARDMGKAERLKRSVAEECGGEILIMPIDLSSFASIHSFCSRFLSLQLPLHILINNAGKYSQNLEFSEDKFELTFATNYLGHFLLTELLLPKMEETASESGVQGSIVNVSSVIHRWANINSFCFTHLLHPKRYNATEAYAQSKLANIMHAKEIARQLKVRNANVSMNAVHPGIVKTGIVRDYNSFFTDSIYFVASKFLKSISQGAATTCYVALSSKTKGMSGKYFADCNEARCSDLANDENEGRRLWKQTQALIHRHPTYIINHTIK